jgi:hypothetical protein
MVVAIAAEKEYNYKYDKKPAKIILSENIKTHLINSF